MSVSPRYQTRMAAVLSGLVLTILVSCGDDSGLGKRYSVSGKVTYKDEPVKSGKVTFTPDDLAQGRSASGNIEDGYYKLTTSVEGDGALPGKYKVTITALETDNSKMEETISKKGGSGRQMDVLKATRAAKTLIPKKYALADTGGLTGEVKEQSNTINFDLKD